MLTRLACLLSLAIITLGAARPLAAAEPATSPALRSALTSLLNDTWEKSADGLLLADKHHRAAAVAGPGDPRVDFALALVQLRYLKYADAEQTLNRLAKAEPEFLPAAQAKIYLSVLMKKHSSALAQIEELNRRVATKPAAVDATQRNEAIEFLGRMFGYYEGPAAGLVSQATVAEVRRRVMEPLGTDDRELFSTAFGSVADRFSQLDDDKRRTQEETKVAEAKQKELDLKRLEAEKGIIAADKNSLQQQAAEAQKQAQEQIDVLDQQIAPLDAEYARINGQGQILRTRIAQIDVSISNLLAQADAEADPVVKASLLGQADLLTFQVRRIELDYQVLDAQAAQVLARRNTLLNQRRGIVARYEDTAKRLGVEAAKLGRNEKRIVVEQKQALKPVTGISPHVQNKATTTASITTYVEFPLERERLRILNSLQ